MPDDGSTVAGCRSAVERVGDKDTISVRFENVRGVSQAWVKRIVEKTLRAARAKVWAIDVLLTDNRSIRKINKQFLVHDYATDVIAFGYGQHKADLVVSAEMAREKARELGLPYREELARYLVHGTLHLLGYKDKKPADHKRMHTRQEKILKVI